MILDEIHLLGADRGPILEVLATVLYFIVLLSECLACLWKNFFASKAKIRCLTQILMTWETHRLLDKS